MTNATVEEARRREKLLLLNLERLTRKRRVMEPRHSREDHECEECEILGELTYVRKYIQQTQERSTHES